MTKYHINPTTGNPGVCNPVATGKCKYGDVEHYSNKTAARDAFNEKMSNNNIMTHSSTDEAKLDSILDLNELNSEIAEGYVNIRTHPEDESLKILCYGKTTQFDGHWNDVTNQCRGLIVKSDTDDFSDAVIVERPWKKFFSLDQHEAGWSLGDEESSDSANDILEQIDFNAPAEVTDKMDGCFRSDTSLNLWAGGTIKIGDVVRKKLSPILIGMNENGELVPTKVIDWHNNGTKNNWLKITTNARISRKSGQHRGNNMYVTDNHSIFINEKFAPASNAAPGDKIVTWEHSLLPDSLHLIRSSLLGDGSVSYGNSNNKNCSYSEGHTEKNIDYVLELNRALGNAATKIGTVKSGYGSNIIRFNSKTYPVLKLLREEWYPKGTKIVPEDLSWMDDFSVAKWFMDDGYKRENNITNQSAIALFATDSFEETDVIRLGEKLKSMYGISYRLSKSKKPGNFNLVVNAGRFKGGNKPTTKKNDINVFWRAIAPFIHPSFKYKLPEEFRNVDYIPMITGGEKIISNTAEILSIEKLENTKKNFPAGRVGFDISTETVNYMSQGMIVHNSMGVLYRAPDGLPALSTKGSFESDQATYYTKMLRSNPDFMNDAEEMLGTNKTHLFELVGPENRIVLDYKEDGIKLLGSVSKNSGMYHSASDSKWSGGHVETIQAKNLNDALTMPDRDEREGVVVRIISNDPNKQLQIKFKQEEYKNLHRILGSMSVGDLRSAVRDSPAKISDLIEAYESKDLEKIPGVTAVITYDNNHPAIQQAMNERREKLTEAAIPRIEKLLSAKKVVESLPSEFFNDPQAQKRFATEIVANNKNLEQGDLFSMFQIRKQGKSANDFPAKNILKSISKEIKTTDLSTEE